MYIGPSTGGTADAEASDEAEKNERAPVKQRHSPEPKRGRVTAMRANCHGGQFIAGIPASMDPRIVPHSAAETVHSQRRW